MNTLTRCHLLDAFHPSSWSADTLIKCTHGYTLAIMVQGKMFYATQNGGYDGYTMLQIIMAMNK